MLNISEEIQSVTAEQLPQYLNSLGLKPQQIAAVVYGLFKEIRQTNTLSPSEDNTIHLSKEKLLQMAKDPALTSDLYNLFLKAQRTKSMDIIFKNDGKSSNLSAPDLWHNPNGCSPKLPAGIIPDCEIEIVDFTKFLAYCGIDPELVKNAMAEKILLKGEN